MAAITLTLLTKYAEEHFPDDFANLPKVNDYSVKRGLLGGFTMHSGNHLLASVSISGLLSCYHSSIKGHEPFCWIETSQKVNENAKLDAFVQFCFMVEGYTCWTKVSKKGFILHFKSACADIAKGMLAKELAEALARVSDLQNRAQHLTPTVDTLVTEPNALPQDSDSPETEMMELRQQFANFMVEAKAGKARMGKESIDWFKHFCASKAEVEELKAKLVKTRAQAVKLENGNAELRKQLSD